MGEGAPEFVTVKFTAATAVVFTVVVLLAALGSLVADVTAEVGQPDHSAARSPTEVPR